MQASKKDINVSICYSNVDEKMKIQLSQHLLALRRSEIINWEDIRIFPDGNWVERAKESFAKADIILLLVGQELLMLQASLEKELILTMERHRRDGTGIIIPVLLNATILGNTPLANLWSLPDDKPVSMYSNPTEAYSNIAAGVSRMIDYFVTTYPSTIKAIAELIEKEKSLRTGILDISNYDLKVIPETVFQLTWLEELVAGGQVPLPNMNSNTSLVQGFRITNYITEIPAGMKKLTKLKRLNLAFNPLVKIQNLEGLSSLISLNLNDASLEEIQNLDLLQALEYLHLGRNFIKEIENIDSLSSLKELYLDGNQISTISNLESLKKLQKLSVNGNNIKDIEGLRKLFSLSWISANTNKITNIEAIRSLTSLQSLDLFNNAIVDIQPLEDLKDLSYLRLSTNSIKDISVLKLLPKLETIRLSENKIEDLSPLFGHIERGMTFVNNINPKKFEISVVGNPVENPDLSYITSGREAQLAFIQSLKDKLVFSYSNILKIILLGNSNCGKTTFRKYLVNDPDYKNQKTTSKLEVETLEWPIKDHPGPLKLKILDFGGQEYFHGTYPLFFSLETLYILLWTVGENKYKPGTSREKFREQNGEKESTVSNEDFDVSYWLNSIEIITRNKNSYIDEIRKNEGVKSGEYWTGQAGEETSLTDKKQSDKRKTKDIPVLLIQNKVDLDDIAYEDIKRFSTSFDRFRIDTLSVSLYEGIRLEFMKNILHQKITETNAHLRKVPDRWINIKNKLIAQFLQEKIISYQQFVEVARQEFPDATKYKDEYLVGIAKYFHSTHEFIYFGDILDGVIVLDTEWFINTIYKLVSGTTTLRDKGIVTLSQLNEMTEESFKKSDVLIEILKESKIIFDHQSGDPQLKEKSYILPQMLPLPEHGADKLLYESFEPASVVIRFNFHLHRILIQALYALLDKEQQFKNRFIYKNGVIVKTKDAMIYIRIEQEKRLIEFMTTKSSAANNELIRNIIFTTLTDTSIKDYTLLNRLPIGKDEPCLCIRLRNGEALVPVKDIEKVAQDISVNKKIATISYENVFYDLIDFAPYAYLMDKAVQMPKRVFISYSHKDTEVFNVFISHFSNLKNEGLISAWHDQMLLAGDKWDNKILSELSSADLVIFLVSQDFINSKYIQEKEFRESYQLKTVIPVKVRSCEYIVFTEDQYANKRPLLPSTDLEGEIVALINEIRKKIVTLPVKSTDGTKTDPVISQEALPGPVPQAGIITN